METRITQNDLCQLTPSIWESTLGLEVRPLPEADLSDREAGTLLGRVQISGARRGTVLLECSRELARKVAGIMFGLGSEEPTNEQVRDALAEMVNITAGNLKSLACGHCHLSLPEVSERDVAAGSAPGEEEVSRQAFECQSERFLVALFVGEADPAGAPEQPGCADEPEETRAGA
jgi:CheY-specific phosphatase CheX